METRTLREQCYTINIYLILKLHALLWPSIIVSPDGCNLKERLMYLNFLFI